MSEKIAAKEVICLALRGYKLWWSENPRFFIAVAFHAIAEALTPFVGIFLMAQIINEIAGNRDPDRLTFLVAVALVSAAVLGLVNAVLERWREYVHAGFRSTHDLLFARKLMEMDFRDADSEHTREKLSQIIQSAQWGWWGFRKLLGNYGFFITGLFKIIGAIALSVSLFTLPVPDDAGTLTVLNHPLFIAVIILLLIGVTTLAPILRNRANSYWYLLHDEMKLGNRIFVFFMDFYYERVRAADMRIYRQDLYYKKYKSNTMTDLFGPKGKLAKYARGPIGLYNAAWGAVGHVFTAIIYIFVCLKAWGGAFGVGSITQYVGAITAMSSGVSSLLECLGDLRNNASYLRDCFNLLDTPNSMYQGSLTTEKRSDNKYEITFKNVSFKYPGSETYALKNINLSFNIGQRLAIVGQNGSGKTTFIKLLCRLYDPTEGEILLNGFDIKKYDYRQYMDIFTVVFQDFRLLSVPLGQNVAAEAMYDEEKATDCLTRAGFAERLGGLHKGLETCLYKDFAEDGVDVSGGEAQKIALARALYRNSPFVILDEPTAALDPVSEFEIYSRMNEIVEDKTAVFISHRLSSCRFCQDIAVFHEGELVQRGNHETLMEKRDEKYRELWDAQAQYYTI